MENNGVYSTSRRARLAMRIAAHVVCRLLTDHTTKGFCMAQRLRVAWVVMIGLSVSYQAEAQEKGSVKVRSPEVEQIVSAGARRVQVMDHLDVLCNRIGPRLTGSDNLTNACEWVRDRFESFGIENARLEPWGEFPVGFNRGPWFGRVIQPEPKSLEFMTMAWSAGTKGAVRGKAVLAPKNKKELDEAKEKGTLAGALGALAATGSGSGGQATRPGFRRSLRKELEDAKAAGIVAPSSSELLVTGGAHRISWDKLPTLPVGDPRCASSSTSSPPGSRTARRSRSSSISAIISRRGRSSSTT